ncbi:MAG: response regulator [Dehalococcoidia bacterium]
MKKHNPAGRSSDGHAPASTTGSFDPKESAVLIVEDNPDDAVLEARALERFGIKHIYHAETAEDALTFAEQQHCDAALIDYQLPGMDGLRFVERLRELSPDTRIIFVTGIRDEHVAVQAMKLGAADYIPKDELLTSGIVRSLQAALRQVDARREEQQTQALVSGAGELDGARQEIDWVLDSLGEAQLKEARVLRLAAYEEHGRKTYPDVLGDYSPLRQLNLEDQGLDVVLETFMRYLREAFRNSLESATEQAEQLARMLITRGTTPAQIISLYRTALGFLELEQLHPAVNPSLCLVRLFADIISQYQVHQSNAAAEDAAA